MVLAGPAVAIFARKLGPIEVTDPGKAMNECDWVLCGSSYPSDFELNFLAKAKARGKHSVVFLDHWINYRERFRRNGTETLPDEIWVGDADAERIARESLPDMPVTLVKNPYFEDLRADLNSRRGRLRRSKKVRALFLSQPIHRYSPLDGSDIANAYTEHEALRYLFAHISSLEKRVDEVMIRLHPSELPDKYDWAVGAFEPPVLIDEDRELIDAILSADYVLGMDSMAMVVGLLAKKEVICCIPQGHKACRLPHEKIKFLKNMH